MTLYGLGVVRECAASADVKLLIEQSATEAAGGSKLMADAAGKLEAILNGMRETSAVMEGIARQSKEPASAIEEVKVGVRQKDEMTQHNAALVEETNAAIEQTEGQAGELDDIVAVFTTVGGPSSAVVVRAAVANRPAARPVAKPAAPVARKAATALDLSQGIAAASTDWNEF